MLRSFKVVAFVQSCYARVKLLCLLKVVTCAADADMDAAIKGAVLAKFRNSGQVLSLRVQG